MADNAKAMATLRGIAEAAGEKGRVEVLDEVVIEPRPGVVLFIGFATEPKPAPKPRQPWWQRWSRTWHSRGC